LWEGINAIYSLIFQSWTGWFLNIHPVVSFFLPGGMSLRIGDVASLNRILRRLLLSRGVEFSCFFAKKHKNSGSCSLTGRNPQFSSQNSHFKGRKNTLTDAIGSRN